jgi:hypothetical protein
MQSDSKPERAAPDFPFRRVPVRRQLSRDVIVVEVDFRGVIPAEAEAVLSLRGVLECRNTACGCSASGV